MTGLRAPLSVRIDDGVTDRMVSRYASGLKFRKVSDGGFHSAEMHLALPRDFFTDLGAGDKVYIYGPSGRTLWEGFADNPGTGDGDGGQVLDLSAMGTMVLAQDQSQPLVYIDTSTSNWQQYRSAGTSPSATAGPSDDPSATNPATAAQGVLCQFNPGQPVATGSVALAGYDLLRTAGMTFGAISFTVVSGLAANPTRWRADLEWAAGTGAYSGAVLTGTTITTTPTPILFFVAGAGAPPAGQDRLGLEIRLAGAATNVADDNTWSFFSAIAVMGRRVNQTGTLLTGTQMAAASPTATYVTASDVVADLVGRLIPGTNPAAVSIDPTTFQIDQLAYPDGTTAGSVLADLAEYEPNMTWELLESSNGYRFNYRAWPTTARYEISTRDGYEAPGGDNDLCNRVLVTWTDATGNKKSLAVTATSATYPSLRPLEDQGRTKDADQIDLPDGRGSATAALQIGTAALASAANPPVAATATVRRRIVDLQTGNRVSPWEIEPGYLVRVRETGDLLRLTELEYDDDAGAAILTLGTPVLTVDQRIARLAKRTP